MKLASSNIVKSKAYDLIEKQPQMTSSELKVKAKQMNQLILSWERKQEEVVLICSVS